jgi:MFS superfamily sulfate permease-like transporter
MENPTASIKGPAAGLIVIVVGAVETVGYQQTLWIVIIAGIIQIIFGLVKIASLANFFPLSAVHGMLAAIGIIILSKQLHFAVGADPSLLKGK